METTQIAKKKKKKIWLRDSTYRCPTVGLLKWKVIVFPNFFGDTFKIAQEAHKRLKGVKLMIYHLILEIQVYEMSPVRLTMG